YNTSGNLFKNNIFKANTSYTVYVGNSAGIQEMDYNDFYTSGANLARWGNTYLGDLSDWQSISGKDANSLNFDPQFQGDTELYASSPALANAGTALTEVTTDIDGTTRKATPSIGANEYDAAALVPLSGTYTIDSTGTGDRNFISFNAAVDSMLINGLAGAVIFEVASDSINEQVIIPDISGGSESNTVTFEAASGNPADVVVMHAATAAGDNFVFRFDNASDIILRNLTIIADGTTGFTRAIHMQNRADNILVENCTIESPLSTSASGDRQVVRIVPSTSSNIRFLNNTITGGSYSIVSVGSSNTSFRAEGYEFIGNQLLDAYYGGLSLEYLNGAIVSGNTIRI
uniref:hypothetical protein n=1 Tax=uncultured Draconibacterium sp. TaxID=1573823 RepID=UPI003217BA1E